MSTPVEIAVKATGTAAASRAIGTVESKTSRLGSVLKGLAVGGVALAGAALVKLGADSVKAASDAQQSIGATETVFGKYADTVIKRSDQAAKAVGLSANEYRELANVTGASLAGAGIPIKKVTDLTGDLTKRAADMAATFGGTTREAIEAVGSALRGETDPIERYGVSIKASDVSARLAATGQDKLTGSALKQAEMMERLKLIFDKTKSSQGAFARESDTLAGAQQRVTAQWENMKAKIGGALLPALSRVTGFIGETVLPGLDKAGEAVGDFIGDIRSGDWSGAWNKAKTATHDALGTIDRLSRNFLADKLLPTVRSGLGKVRESWAHQWEQFWKDPDRAYDKVLNHEKVFSDTMIGRGEKTAKDYTFTFIRQWQKLPGAAAREGTRTLNAWKQSMQGMPRLATSIAVDVAGGFMRGVNSLPGKARALAIHAAAGMITGFRGAISGAAAIGAAIVGGLLSGITSRVEEVASSAASLVTRALSAARHAADAHSPSRKMRRLGRDMTDGLILGFDDGSAGVAKVLGRLTDLIATTYAARAKSARKRIDNAKAERQALNHLTHAENARTKSLKKLDNALVENGKRQDKNNAALENARGKLKEILDTSREYASSIREAVTATGDVTTLGKDEAGTATISGILDQMRTRVQAAQRYADLISTLTKAGLNKTSLRQILAAGVEGGLTTAEALAAGGPAAITQVNKLTGQLEAAGTGLGDSAAATMYGAGVKAAEGIVRGLESKEKRIDRTAKRLANTLANAVRRALKVQSPSKVFEDIGKRTVEGLRVGLDDTHVRTSGRKLAASLVDGFSDPKLTATAVLDATTRGGAGNAPILVELTAQQVSDVEAGRRIQLKIDAFNGEGGRRRKRG